MCNIYHQILIINTTSYRTRLTYVLAYLGSVYFLHHFPSSFRLRDAVYYKTCEPESVINSTQGVRRVFSMKMQIFSSVVALQEITRTLMSYQHDDPPDADHYPAGGHLRPAEKKRRHAWCSELSTDQPEAGGFGVFIHEEIERNGPSKGRSLTVSWSASLGKTRNLSWRRAQQPIRMASPIDQSASISCTYQSGSTSEVAQHFLYPVYLCCTHISIFFPPNMWYLNDPGVFHRVYSDAHCCKRFYFWV